MPKSLTSLTKIIILGALFFIIANALFIALPIQLGQLSLYNHLYPGRERFPYGDDPTNSYNLTLFDLDAMFASHVISDGIKAEGEYRVIMIGDSSLWGWRLLPEETLPGLLNSYPPTCDNPQVHVYNMGYPGISLTKDLLILDRSMRYQPDLIVWFVTLEAFPLDKQLTNDLVTGNQEQTNILLEKYNLVGELGAVEMSQSNYWQSTIIGERRAIADILRLQLYGVLWGATGIDQAIPDKYEPAQVDFDQNVTFHEMEPPVLDKAMLAFQVLSVGMAPIDGTPVILVNQPTLISSGENSLLRYNYYYPRWAFDQYRDILSGMANERGWDYLDLWDLVPADEFTNTPFHLTPTGESQVAAQIRDAIQQRACP